MGERIFFMTAKSVNPRGEVGVKNKKDLFSPFLALFASSSVLILFSFWRPLLLSLVLSDLVHIPSYRVTCQKIRSDLIRLLPFPCYYHPPESILLHTLQSTLQRRSIFIHSSVLLHFLLPRPDVRWRRM